MSAPVRRLGSEVIHSATYPESMRIPATIFGAPCVIVDSPVAADCGAILRGHVVEMEFFGPSHTCRRCGVQPQPRPAAPAVSSSTGQTGEKE